MSDLSLVLQTILRSKEPLTTEQVAQEVGISEARCRTYFNRLMKQNRIIRAGSVDNWPHKSKALYGKPEKICD